MLVCEETNEKQSSEDGGKDVLELRETHGASSKVRSKDGEIFTELLVKHVELENREEYEQSTGHRPSKYRQGCAGWSRALTA